VLEPSAFLRDVGRQRRVIGRSAISAAVQYLRVLIRSDVGIPVDPHLGSPGFSSRSKITASDSLVLMHTARWLAGVAS